MSAVRLIVGIIVMGITVPIILFFVLDLHTISELLVVFATTFLAWGVTDLLATILEKPRLRDRSPGRAIRSFNPEGSSLNPERSSLNPERSEGSTENPH